MQNKLHLNRRNSCYSCYMHYMERKTPTCTALGYFTVGSWNRRLLSNSSAAIIIQNLFISYKLYDFYFDVLAIRIQENLKLTIMSMIKNYSKIYLYMQKPIFLCFRGIFGSKYGETMSNECWGLSCRENLRYFLAWQRI